MRINLFLLAEYANNSEDKKLNIMGVFNQINAFQFPTRYPSMYLVLSMSPELGEFGDTRNVTIRLFEPDGGELMKISQSCQFPNIEQGKIPTANFVINLRDLIFPKPGPYIFIVQLEKEQKAQVLMYLNQVEKPQEPQQPQPGS
jgi:hypothetical protein